MSDEVQAMCFVAGANSMFFGDRLLTTDNAATAHDLQLLQRLGMALEERQHACAELEP
jgi:biotin synthase